MVGAVGCSSNSSMAAPELDGAAGGSADVTPNAGGASGTAGDAANSVATSTIGDLFPTMSHLLFDVNIQDGFAAYENDTYAIDLDSGHLDYVHEVGSPSTTGTGVVSTADAVNATQAQVAALVAAVSAAKWREQREPSECPDQAYVFADGQSYAPIMTVTSTQLEMSFGASDATCATSKHSAHGRVMSTSAFFTIFDALIAIRPGGSSPQVNCW